MNKNRLCYIVRSRYPEVCGIRKQLQKGKVKRLYRTTMPNALIKECEADPSKKAAAIAPYVKKWEKALRSIHAEMEDILEHAPAYKDRTDKEALRTDMLFCRLAYGFLPSEYVAFELEHKPTEERRTYASDRDTNVFGYSVNNIRELQGILDKGDCCKVFQEYFHRDILVVEHKNQLEEFLDFLHKHPVLVEKQVFSSMGRGTRLVDFETLGISEEEYFEYLLAGGKYLLEEVVVQHPDMARFHEASVNTVRCITFNTKNGVVIPYAFMRSGRNGSFVDNGGSGGLVIGINEKTGIVSTDGFDEYGERYPVHPNSGVVFQGSVIPEWDALTEICIKGTSKVKEINYLSWDLAYTEKGWVVIEVNEVGQFIGPQMTTKKGIRKELKKYLKIMKKVI